MCQKSESEFLSMSWKNLFHNVKVALGKVSFLATFANLSMSFYTSYIDTTISAFGFNVAGYTEVSELIAIGLSFLSTAASGEDSDFATADLKSSHLSGKIGASTRNFGQALQKTWQTNTITSGKYPTVIMPFISLVLFKGKKSDKNAEGGYSKILRTSPMFDHGVLKLKNVRRVQTLMERRAQKNESPNEICLENIVSLIVMMMEDFNDKGSMRSSIIYANLHQDCSVFTVASTKAAIEKWTLITKGSAHKQERELHIVTLQNWRDWYNNS
jgi:hypothetical protein